MSKLDDDMWGFFVYRQIEHSNKVDDLIDQINSSMDKERIIDLINNFDDNLNKSDLDKIREKTRVSISIK